MASEEKVFKEEHVNMSVTFSNIEYVPNSAVIKIWNDATEVEMTGWWDVSMDAAFWTKIFGVQGQNTCNDPSFSTFYISNIEPDLVSLSTTTKVDQAFQIKNPYARLSCRVMNGTAYAPCDRLCAHINPIPDNGCNDCINVSLHLEGTPADNQFDPPSRTMLQGSIVCRYYTYDELSKSYLETYVNGEDAHFHAMRDEGWYAGTVINTVISDNGAYNPVVTRWQRRGRKDANSQLSGPCVWFDPPLMQPETWNAMETYLISGDNCHGNLENVIHFNNKAGTMVTIGDRVKIKVASIDRYLYGIIASINGMAGDHWCNDAIVDANSKTNATFRVAFDGGFFSEQFNVQDHGDLLETVTPTNDIGNRRYYDTSGHSPFVWNVTNGNWRWHGSTSAGVDDPCRTYPEVLKDASSKYTDWLYSPTDPNRSNFVFDLEFLARNMTLTSIIVRASWTWLNKIDPTSVTQDEIRSPRGADGAHHPNFAMVRTRLPPYQYNLSIDPSTFAQRLMITFANVYTTNALSCCATGTEALLSTHCHPNYRSIITGNTFLSGMSGYYCGRDLLNHCSIPDNFNSTGFLGNSCAAFVTENTSRDPSGTEFSKKLLKQYCDNDTENDIRCECVRKLLGSDINKSYNAPCTCKTLDDSTGQIRIVTRDDHAGTILNSVCVFDMTHDGTFEEIEEAYSDYLNTTVTYDIKPEHVAIVIIAIIGYGALIVYIIKTRFFRAAPSKYNSLSDENKLKFDKLKAEQRKSVFDKVLSLLGLLGVIAGIRGLYIGMTKDDVQSAGESITRNILETFGADASVDKDTDKDGVRDVRYEKISVYTPFAVKDTKDCHFPPPCHQYDGLTSSLGAEVLPPGYSKDVECCIPRAIDQSVVRPEDIWWNENEWWITMVGMGVGSAVAEAFVVSFAKRMWKYVMSIKGKQSRFALRLFSRMDMASKSMKSMSKSLRNTSKSTIRNIARGGPNLAPVGTKKLINKLVRASATQATRPSARAAFKKLTSKCISKISTKVALTATAKLSTRLFAKAFAGSVLGGFVFAFDIISMSTDMLDFAGYNTYKSNKELKTTLQTLDGDTQTQEGVPFFLFEPSLAFAAEWVNAQQLVIGEFQIMALDYFMSDPVWEESFFEAYGDWQDDNNSPHFLFYTEQIADRVKNQYFEDRILYENLLFKHLNNEVDRINSNARIREAVHSNSWWMFIRPRPIYNGTTPTSEVDLRVEHAMLLDKPVLKITGKDGSLVTDSSDPGFTSDVKPSTIIAERVTEWPMAMASDHLPELEFPSGGMPAAPKSHTLPKFHAFLIQLVVQFPMCINMQEVQQVTTPEKCDPQIPPCENCESTDGFVSYFRYEGHIYRAVTPRPWHGILRHLASFNTFVDSVPAPLTDPVATGSPRVCSTPSYQQSPMLMKYDLPLAHQNSNEIMTFGVTESFCKAWNQAHLVLWKYPALMTAYMGNKWADHTFYADWSNKYDSVISDYEQTNTALGLGTLHREKQTLYRMSRQTLMNRDGSKSVNAAFMRIGWGPYVSQCESNLIDGNPIYGDRSNNLPTFDTNRGVCGLTDAWCKTYDMSLKVTKFCTTEDSCGIGQVVGYSDPDPEKCLDEQYFPECRLPNGGDTDVATFFLGETFGRPVSQFFAGDSSTSCSQYNDSATKW